MMVTSLEKTRGCCKNPPIFLILFDGAGTPDLPIRVCKSCSEKPLFQKFIKTRISINHDSDVEAILKSF